MIAMGIPANAYKSIVNHGAIRSTTIKLAFIVPKIEKKVPSGYFALNKFITLAVIINPKIAPATNIPINAQSKFIRCCIAHSYNPITNRIKDPETPGIIIVDIIIKPKTNASISSIFLEIFSFQSACSPLLKIK